jgi:hypothetical protein
MKDLPHHMKQLNRKILRSVQRELTDETLYTMTPSEEHFRNPRKKKKKPKHPHHEPLDIPTNDERNRKMKHRVPIFDRNNAKPKHAKASHKHSHSQTPI